MGHSNGIITDTQVSIYDVAYVLGAASNDVGTLCKHSNVNMWSKHKPVSYPHLEDTSRTMSVNPWIGDEPINVPYGITLPSASGSDTIPISLLTTNIGYKKPSGGANSPYRLGDFRGYNHNCITPYRVDMLEGEHAENETHLLCYLIRLTPDVELPTNNIAFNDIFPNAYFGVMVVNGNSRYYKTIPNDRPSIDIGDCPLFKSGNTIEIYACMIKNQLPQWVEYIGDNNTIYSVASNNIVTKSEVIVKAPWANSFKAVCVFSDGSHILSAKGSASMNDGKITATFNYVNPETIRKTYDLTSVTLEAKDLNDDKVYTKPSISNTGEISFTDAYVGRLDIMERPGSTVTLSCSHYSIVGSGHYGDYVYTFHFTARASSGGGANI